MNYPFFSVIVTTHKRPTYLSRALDSLINQSLQDFEIILISDITDIDTHNIALEYLRDMDTFVMNPYLVGPSESRNLGIQLSKGQWVCFLDDDDAFSLNFLENFQNNLNSDLSDVYYTNFIKVEEDRNINEFLNLTNSSIRNTPIDLIMIRNFIPNSCVIVNSLLAKNINFDVTLKSHEDWDWLINLKMKSNFKHMDILGPIIYESTNDSRNQNSVKSNQFIYDYLTIYRKWPVSDSFTINARHQVLLHFGLPVSIDILS